MENTNEYVLVDFLVYSKYIKMNLPDTEITVATYAITNSVAIVPFYMNYVFIYVYGFDGEPLNKSSRKLFWRDG